MSLEHRSPRQSYEIPVAVRIIGAVVGLILISVGRVAWSFEREYGGDADRPEYVVAQEGDEVSVIDEAGRIVYRTDTPENADAWVEEQRGGRDFTVPVILLAAGALTLVAVILPSLPARLVRPRTTR